MIIKIDYEIGLGGIATVSVTEYETAFNFKITEFKESKYGDIGIEVFGDVDKGVISTAYNRNNLSNTNYVNIEEYRRAFIELRLIIIKKIEKLIQSFFQ